MAERGGRWAVWVAQGFGLGRMPVAPGTFGSVGGLMWFAVLIWVGMLWVYVGALIVGVIGAVLIGERAERALGEKDPSSIVLDEIIAVPLCFAVWVGVLCWDDGKFPGLEAFFGSGTWWRSAAVFVGFRIFDVWKPWPVRQVQALPGGWGLTVDDVLAAGYVNGCVWLGLIWLR